MHRVQRYGHHIAIVRAEVCDGFLLFNVPQDAGGVATGRQDLSVVYKPARAEIPLVGPQFDSRYRGILGTCFLEVENGAEVVQTTTGNEFSARSIGTRHYPARL